MKTVSRLGIALAIFGSGITFACTSSTPPAEGKPRRLRLLFPPTTSSGPCRARTPR